MYKLQLTNVTLIAVGSTYIHETADAINKSTELIDFGAVKYLTSAKNTAEHYLSNIEVEQINPLNSLDEYSHFMLFGMPMFVDTDYVLTIQHDGYVLRPDLWDRDWLTYDYIGAPWPEKTHYTPEGVEVRVGNGGFSLRSRKLLQTFLDLKLPFTDKGTGFFNEDGNLCCYHRKALEEAGINYAPPEIAAKFSRELKVRESITETFGFHRYL